MRPADFCTRYEPPAFGEWEEGGGREGEGGMGRGGEADFCTQYEPPAFGEWEEGEGG